MSYPISKENDLAPSSDEDGGEGIDLADFRRRAATSAFWSAFESGSLALVSFVTLIAYARLLDPADFGAYAVALSIYEILGVGTGMLFHDALIQRRKLDDDVFSASFTFSIALSIAAAGCIWAAYLAYFEHRLGHDAWTCLAFLSLTLPFNAAATILLASYRRNFHFRAAALRSLGARLAGGVIGILFAVFGFRYWSLVFQQIIISSVSFLILWLFAGRRPRLIWRPACLFDTLRFGLPSLMSLLLSYSFKRILLVASGAFFGSAIAGLMTVGVRIVDAPWSLTATAISQVLLPFLARLVGDPSRYNAEYLKLLQWANFAFLPCFVGLSLVAQPLADLLLGQRWQGAAQIMSLASLLTLFQLLKLFAGPALSGIGKPQEGIFWYLPQLILLVALMWMMRDQGIHGALTAWAIAEVITTPIALVRVKLRLGLPFLSQLQSISTPLVAVALMATVVVGLDVVIAHRLGSLPRLLILGGAGALVYICSVMLLDRNISNQARLLFLGKTAFET